MLVLTRRLNQTIMIGDDISVTVVEVHGEYVRLGVTAPRDTTVHRKEIWQQVKAENEAAARMEPADVFGDLSPAFSR